jgi:hypothetical protein
MRAPISQSAIETTNASREWSVLHSGPGGAALNMAVDHALLETAPGHGAVLRFYSWSEPAASFGYFQKYAEIEAVTHLRPLVRRPTGGGLVPHDADWTYSLVFPPGDPWYRLKAVESYRRVHEWIQSAFGRLNVATTLAACCHRALPGQCFEGYEQSDVLWNGRKIAGAAQRRTRHGLLIQGSVQPGMPGLARSDWEQAMCDVARKEQGVQWRALAGDAALRASAEDLTARIYSRLEYNRRR